ncbi:hypothetical protein NHQ30_010624 [Ciborinia camelliae]|nr:hypothetical protein NHQ30_010624 [Ciborinia camelliae]
MGNSNEYVPAGAVKQWNTFAGNPSSKQSQTASQSNQPAAQSKSKALIKAEPDVMFTDTMGMETIILKVGPSSDDEVNGTGTMVFTIHKNLLIGSSRRFAKLVRESGPERNKMYSIHDTSPLVFKLFNEYLYKGRIPTVTRRMTEVEKGTRISELCQLYVFAEIFEMDNTFLNKIMDALQDALSVGSTILTHTLVKNILEHAEPESPLRKFCAANALYTAMTPGLDSTGFQWLIKNSNEFFAEFMKMLVKLTNGNDPRIRDFNQEYAKEEIKVKEEELEAGGVSVGAGAVTVTPVGPGVHPCQFHVHGRPSSVGGSVQPPDDDEVCYLFADLDM